MSEENKRKPVVIILLIVTFISGLVGGFVFCHMSREENYLEKDEYCRRTYFSSFVEEYEKLLLGKKVLRMNI
jgi:hypothetical protein